MWQGCPRRASWIPPTAGGQRRTANSKTHLGGTMTQRDLARVRYSLCCMSNSASGHGWRERGREIRGVARESAARNDPTTPSAHQRGSRSPFRLWEKVIPKLLERWDDSLKFPKSQFLLKSVRTGRKHRPHQQRPATASCRRPRRICRGSMSRMGSFPQCWLSLNMATHRAR